MEPKQISEVLKQQTKTKTSSVGSVTKITSEQFKAVIFGVCPDFELESNPDLKTFMNDLFLYVNGKSSRLDPDKGILIWGDIGTGKSTIIKIIGELLRCKNQGYKTVNCSFLSTQFAANGLSALNSSTYNNADSKFSPVNRAFDELGREPIPARHFGNELNVMQYVFQCRYELRERVKTFATTNLKPSALGVLYGEYISDRITEMFNIVNLKGKSRRK